MISKSQGDFVSLPRGTSFPFNPYKKLKAQNKNSDDLEVPRGTSFSFNL
jgi:hypothetical protein